MYGVTLHGGDHNGEVISVNDDYMNITMPVAQSLDIGRLEMIREGDALQRPSFRTLNYIRHSPGDATLEGQAIWTKPHDDRYCVLCRLAELGRITTAEADEWGRLRFIIDNLGA